MDKGPQRRNPLRKESSLLSLSELHKEVQLLEHLLLNVTAGTRLQNRT